MDDRLNIEILSDYLGQYRRAIRRKRELERRLEEIHRELQSPIKGINYSLTSTKSSDISAGAAGLVYQESEQELRITDQTKIAEDSLVDIMDVLGHLEDNSDEREALELHYIDGMKWEQVGMQMHMVKSTVFRKRKDGLEKLLTFARVRAKIRTYAEREKLL